MGAVLEQILFAGLWTSSWIENNELNCHMIVTLCGALFQPAFPRGPNWAHGYSWS